MYIPNSSRLRRIVMHEIHKMPYYSLPKDDCYNKDSYFCPRVKNDVFNEFPNE